MWVDEREMTSISKRKSSVRQVTIIIRTGNWPSGGSAMTKELFTVGKSSFTTYSFTVRSPGVGDQQTARYYKVTNKSVLLQLQQHQFSNCIHLSNNADHVQFLLIEGNWLTCYQTCEQRGFSVLAGSCSSIYRYNCHRINLIRPSSPSHHNALTHSPSSSISIRRS